MARRIAPVNLPLRLTGHDVLCDVPGCKRIIHTHAGATLTLSQLTVSAGMHVSEHHLT